MTAPEEGGALAASDRDATPLVVDVDGTLVNGDLSIEGLARLCATSPAKALAALSPLLRGGRAAVKRGIARAIAVPPPTLVLNPAVVDEIDTARAAGRDVWLASASDALAVAPLVEAVGATGYLASDGHVNLAGQAKAEALVARFGEGGFDYVGNERRDLAVWRRARRAIAVAPSAGLARAVRALDAEARFLAGAGGSARDRIRALRPLHWIKNVLVFVPLVAAHQTDALSWLAAAAVFAAFSACASSAYLLNDLLDLPHDRQHARKRHRPLAAGKVGVPWTVGAAAALAAGGLAAAFSVSVEAGACLAFYLVTTVVYSLYLKRQLLIDVVALAALYAVRVAAGGAAAAVMLSPWLIAFAGFAFLALAAVKRQSELHVARRSDKPDLEGRAYRVEDLPAMAGFGMAGSFASVVVLALYIQSPDVNGLYERPAFLWAACLFSAYWLGRAVLLANRGAVHDDPVVFAVRDRTSWLTGAGILAAFAVAL